MPKKATEAKLITNNTIGCKSMVILEFLIYAKLKIYQNDVPFLYLTRSPEFLSNEP